MSPQLRFRLRQLGLTIRDFAAITGVSEDSVSDWGRKPHTSKPVRPEPLWAKHLIRAWQFDPSLLREAMLAAHLALSIEEEESRADTSASGLKFPL